MTLNFSGNRSRIFLRFLAFAALMVIAGCRSEEKELRKKIVSAYDPQKLQQWAKPLLAEEKVYYEIPRDRWPETLRDADGPSSAWIAGWTYTSKQAVMLSWGGGFGHRVVIVGDEDFVINEEDLGSPVERWIPGVYFALDAK